MLDELHHEHKLLDELSHVFVFLIFVLSLSVFFVLVPILYVVLLIVLIHPFEAMAHDSMRVIEQKLLSELNCVFPTVDN